MRRPSHVRGSMTRSYDKGGRASHHLHWHARRTTLRNMRVTQRAVLRVAPVRSSVTSWTEGTIPLSLLGLARTSLVRRCFYVASPSLLTPRNMQSTGTSGHWWRPPPFSRRRSLHCNTGSWPLAQRGGWGRTSRIAPSTHHSSCREWRRKLWLHRSLTRRPLHTDLMCANGSGPTMMLIASSTINATPGTMVTPIEWWQEQAARAPD